MKRHRLRRVEAVAVGVVAGIMGALLLPTLPGLAAVADGWHQMQEAQRQGCQGNLKQITLAVSQYTQDYDECYPTVTGDASDREYGWAASLQPYARNLAIFQCPADKHPAGTNPLQPGYTDYWYNRNLSRVHEGVLKFSSSTMLLGDGDGGYKASNARYALNALPQSWLTTPNSPARRHLDGANYAFTDGHIKWMLPERLSTTELNSRVPTFRVQ